MDSYVLCTICGIVIESAENIDEHFNVFHSVETDDPSSLNSCENQTNGSSEENPDIVWSSSRNPTKHDIEATTYFLELRKSDKYSKLFDNKRTQKNHVWAMIAKEMQQAGYMVGEGKNGLEKCRQKYANLVKSYNNTMKHRKTTGAEKKAVPEYFDLLHSILSPLHKINPVYTIDSNCNKELHLNEYKTSSTESAPLKIFPASTVSDEELRNEDPKTPINNEVGSDKNEINVDLNKSRTKVQANKKSLKTTVTDTILKCHEEIKEQNEKHLNRVETLIKEGNAQKNEFLGLFKQLVEHKIQKKNVNVPPQIQSNFYFENFVHCKNVANNGPTMD